MSIDKTTRWIHFSVQRNLSTRNVSTPYALEGDFSDKLFMPKGRMDHKMNNILNRCISYEPSGGEKKSKTNCGQRKWQVSRNQEKMLHWCFSTSHVIDDANRINIWTSKEKKKMSYFPNPTNFPPKLFFNERRIMTVC